MYKYSENHSLKLKYFEAAILSEIILQYSIIKPEQINQTPVDEFIEFIDFTYKKHNTSQNKKKYNNEHHPSIYKVS